MAELGSHHPLGGELEQTKTFGQDKGGIANGMEKSLGVIGSFLQVDRHADRLEGLVEIQARVAALFMVQLCRCDRRSVFKESANVGTIAAVSRNGSTAGADWL
jgi:hypothetical protein